MILGLVYLNRCSFYSSLPSSVLATRSEYVAVRLRSRAHTQQQNK